MYRLEVFHADAPSPTESVSLRGAGEVLRAIPALLERHPDCVRVEVYAGPTRLFSVDCEGNRLGD